MANDDKTIWGDDLVGVLVCRRHFAQGGVDDRVGARDGGGPAAVEQKVSRRAVIISGGN